MEEQSDQPHDLLPQVESALAYWTEQARPCRPPLSGAGGSSRGASGRRLGRSADPRPVRDRAPAPPPDPARPGGGRRTAVRRLDRRTATIGKFGIVVFGRTGIGTPISVSD